jgi:PAS domain S-box-containing protein
MNNILKNNFNKLLILLYIVLVIGIISFVIQSVKNEIQEYKFQENSHLSQKIHAEVMTLINEKKDSTLAMAISLASNDIFRTALKNDAYKDINLKEITDNYEKNTIFKNIWLQILDKDGKSFLRSWTNKRGDDLSFREDVKTILKDKQIKTTISVGIFSISFKSMVPIIENGELLGVFEIISHFNSIEKKLSERGYSSIVIVDKKFEKQLTNSITKTFIDGYYVANFIPDMKIIDVIKEIEIKNLLTNNKSYFEYKKNHILTSHPILNNEKEAIGYVLVLAPNGISNFNINKIYLIQNLYGFIVFLALSLIFILLLDKKHITQKLNNYSYKTKIIIYMLMFFIAVALFLYKFLEYEKNSKIANFLEQTTNENEKIYSQIYSKYLDLSTIIFKSKIDTQDIKNILLIEDKEKSRKELYKYLENTYKLYESYNLKQLHFHTADNKSFLRFHRPDKYGDDLTGVRHTVEYVNKHKKPINGFEEGKIYNGFRFVYPIFNNDIYLGSVEVSFSVMSMLEELINNFEFNGDFFIKKESVKSSLMNDELGNYSQSAMDDFFIERAISDKLSITHKNISLIQENKEEINSINQSAKDKEAFSFISYDQKEVVTFIPLINPILNQSVGVIALSKKHSYIKNKIENTLYTYFTLISIIALSLFLAYREMINRRNTELFNEQLNNAQKISKIGNWELDLLVNELYWSDEVYNIFEIDKELFHVNYETFLNAIHPDDVEIVNNAYQKSLQNQEPYSIEHRLLMSDGRIKYVREKCNSTFDGDGIATNSSGTIQDITEQKLAELETIEARKKSEDANKTKSEFLANMSHEIRTPMNAIIGLGSILNDLLSEPKQKDILQKINSSSNMLLGIINDILDYSKIEAGKLELEHKNFESENLLSQLKVMFEYKACEKEIELYFHIKNDLPRILVSDELRLMQILSNLLSNAIKFTHKGHVTLNVELLSKNHDTNKATIRFSVEDSGIGMNNEQLSRIFNPFTQADSSTTREFGGTGLGLVISQNIIQALGGDIKVASNFGKGSIFSFELDLEFASCELKYTIVSKECHKVLIVDDQEIARTILRDMLENFGCECVEASNGMEALEIIEKSNKENQEFDILLIDWNMPILNGVDTLKKFKEMEYKKAPTLFMISAHEKGNIDFDDVKIDSFISKPVTPSSLFDALAETKKGYSIKQNKNLTAIPNLNGLSILVVEDNEINQQVASMLLQKVGIFVDLASNGKEGFEKFKANQTKYDLILMDLQMPIMSGYESTRNIREINKTIPIIALTAAAMIEDKQKALEAGMNDHLGKPINQNELYKTISKFTKREFSYEKSEKNINSILDLGFLQSTLSSKELINSLLIKFKEQLTIGEFKNIIQTIKNQDKEASQLIHTLKGVSGNLGANELFGITKLIDFKYKTNEQITQNDFALLELSIQNILIKLNDIKNETTINLPSTQKIQGDELQKLLIFIKNSLENGDLIDNDLKSNLISNLYGIVKNDELEEFKKYIDEFEFDKALAILKGWDI